MKRLSISKLAEQLGINHETIRYYERIELVTSPLRTPGGHRVYAESDVKRLRFICRARALGFSIAEVRALLELSEPARFSCDEVRKIARHQLDTVRSQLAELQQVERALANALENCDVSDKSACPVLNMFERPDDADQPLPPRENNNGSGLASCCSGR